MRITKYKKTELGFLPVEWNLMKLHEIGDIVTGSTPNTKIVDYYGGDYLFVTPGDISEKKYVSDSEKKLTKKGFDVSRKIPKNSIMVTCIGYIGKIAMTDREVATNQQINSIIPNKGIISDYIYYSLDYYFNKVKNRVIEHQVVPIINKTKFSHFLLPIPSISEQRKIADILSTWDKAIELKEKLIEQKKEQKKGLMQRLLTGKVRLPGFEGEWEEVQVKDVCEIGRGRVISKKEIEQNQGIYPVYSSQTSNNGEIGRINTYDYDGEYITWTTDGVNAGTVFYRKGKFNCTNVCGTLKLLRHDIDARYFSLMLQGETDKYVVRHGNPKLMNNVMAIITVRIFNNYEYQKFICDIFDMADREITLLEQEVEALKQQKKGLMQLLLTGKVRLKC